MRLAFWMTNNTVYSLIVFGIMDNLSKVSMNELHNLCHHVPTDESKHGSDYVRILQLAHFTGLQLWMAHSHFHCYFYAQV